MLLRWCVLKFAQKIISNFSRIQRIIKEKQLKIKILASKILYTNNAVAGNCIWVPKVGLKQCLFSIFVIDLLHNRAFFTIQHHRKRRKNRSLGAGQASSPTQTGMVCKALFFLFYRFINKIKTYGMGRDVMTS